MLKNKIIVRKIRNIVILIMVMIIMLGAYKNIDKSKAEKVIEIGAKALDNYGYLADEEFVLEAKQLEDDKYEVGLPDSINTKKINQIVKVTLEDIEPETTNENGTTENTVIEETTLEIVGNKIYLTKDQIENQQINIEAVYDVAILKQKQDGTYSKTILTEKVEKTEEINMLYNKVLKYEDEESGKLVELKGYLPVDAQIQVKEVTQEQLPSMFANVNMEVAYDINIFVTKITTKVDEANPTSEPEKIIETIEINPEEFGETCEVLIKDSNIIKNSQVFHVKDDNTYEQVKVKQSTDGNISFEAQTFSVYAVINETANISETGELPSTEYTTPYLPTNFSPVAGTDLTTGFVIQDQLGNQYVWVEVPRNTTVYTESTLALDLNNLTGDELTNAYNTIEDELYAYTYWYGGASSEFPDNETLNAALGIETVAEYTKLKQKMLKSVFEKGGFYVGRYETGIDYSEGFRTESGAETIQTPVIKQNAFPYNSVTAKQAQNLATGMGTGNYKTSLMFGVQWNLILKHIETKAVEKGVLLTTIQNEMQNSVNWGNFLDSAYTITNPDAYCATYDLTTGNITGLNTPPYSKASGQGAVVTTGANDTFSKMNIYDLAGNMGEWTLEYFSDSNPCVMRGGHSACSGTASIADPRLVSVGGTETAHGNTGFRVMLFEDTTQELPSTEYTTPYLPTNFSPVAGTDLSTGFVIQDQSENQYVWVEVPRNTTVYTESTLALNLNNLTGDALTNAYNTIEDELKSYTSAYRGETYQKDEFPDDATVDAVTGIETVAEYTKLKQKMLKSVFEHGGFYIGRYETGTKDIYRDYGADFVTEHPISDIPVIQANAYPYGFVTCAQAQTVANSMSFGEYKSSLMFGLQWDLTMKYLQTKGVEESKLNEDSTTWGNYTNNSFIITNTKASYNLPDLSTYALTEWKTAPYTHNEYDFALLTTGASDTFSKQGIYDLAGNAYEWTLEYNANDKLPIVRGGVLLWEGYDTPASSRDSFGASWGINSHPGFSFRTMLFKDTSQDSGDQGEDSEETEDLVEPTWETGNINIDKANKKVTVELIAKDKYIDIENKILTQDEITVYMDGVNAITSGKVKMDLSVPTLVTETVNGKTVNYGAIYILTLTDWEVREKQEEKLYLEWSGTTSIKILEGAAIDQNGNISKEQELELGKIDFINPNFIYTYSESDIDYEGKTVKVTFSVIDKYFKESTLKIEDLTILINGKQPEWRTEGGTTGVTRQFTNIVDIEATINEERKVIGKEYILLLSNLQQDPNNGLDYSGVITIGIPQRSVSDLNGNTNLAKTITIGMDMQELVTNPYLPTGFTQVSGTNLDTGLVIQDSGGNQYVWVEVPRDTTVYSESTLALYLDSLTGTELTNAYKKIEDDLKAYTTVYRNGTTYTDSYYSDAATGLTSSKYTELKQKMLKSVFINGGFYIGRYEAGTTTARTSSSSTLYTPVIKPNVYPYNLIKPSQAQTQAEKLAVEGYTTSLMFGVQWDLVLKYLETKALEKGTSLATIQEQLKGTTTGSTSWGNYKNDTFTMAGNSYLAYSTNGTSWNSLPSGSYLTKSSTNSMLFITGAWNKYNKQNIYDLAGNVNEWTLEFGNDSKYVSVFRGGGYIQTGYARPASYRGRAAYNGAYTDVGFRVALFKEEKAVPVDVIDPVWKAENIQIDEDNKQVTVDLIVTDRYLDTTLAVEDIKIFTDGIDATQTGNVTKVLSEPTALTQTIDGETVQYGAKYTLTLTDWGAAGVQQRAQYTDGSGTVSLQIPAGAITDESGNPSEELNTELGNFDFINPKFTYIYSESNIDRDEKIVEIVFSVTDKYFKESTLTSVDQLTILIDGEEPEWRTEGGTTGVTRKITNVADIIDGENKIVGKQYTLLLSNLQQDPNDGFNYSGVVTIGIPQGIASDEKGNTNSAKTITLGMDMQELATNPYLPQGFSKVLGTNLDTGLVIQDSDGNQYVWVEVPRNTTVYSASTLGLDLDNLSGEALTNACTKIENDLQKYTNDYYKDRSIFSYTDTHGADSLTGLTSNEYTELKQNMLKSVFKNGGFYIGRYETGTTSARTSGSSTTAPTAIPYIKANQIPYTYVTPSQAQTLAEEFAGEGYTTSLMFGIQWDLIMKYLETKAIEKGTSLATIQEQLKGYSTGSTNWGNYYNNKWTITNTSSQYSTNGTSWTSGLYNGTGRKTSSASVLLTTGASSTFSKQNIYDLAGNVREVTLERYSTSRITYRGGHYDNSGYNDPANDNYTIYYSTTDKKNGFRVMLIGNGKSMGEGVDVVSPIWETENINIDEENEQVTVDLIVVDKYIDEGALTAEDIIVYVDGINVTSSGIVSKSLSEPTIATKTIDGETVAYGAKYTLTLTDWKSLGIQEGRIYADGSGMVSIQIPKGGTTDLSGNPSEELNLELGNADFIEPDFSYIYSESDIDYDKKTVKVVFSGTDRYFKESTLEADNLTILIDGKEPEWRTEGGTTGVTKELTSKEITEERNGENVIVGYTYTLLLSNLEQNPNDGFNYSGVVTVSIPAGKVTDTTGMTNKAKTITVGTGISDTIEETTPTTPELPSTEYTAPYLPTGFSPVAGTDLSTGLVIEDASKNQYVWVEVPRNETVYGSDTLYLDLDNMTETELKNAYTQIENALKTYAKDYRTRSSYYVDTHYSDSLTGLTSSEYTELKQKMLKSVFENGGFYVGRYETGTTSGRTSGSTTTTPTATPYIQANLFPYIYVTPSQAQTLAKKFAREGYTTSLMFGIQWDLIMKYLETKAIEKGVDPETIQEELKGTTTGSTSWGNYYNNPWTITSSSTMHGIVKAGGYLNWYLTPYGTKSKNKDVYLSTGASSSFSKQNIYDLAGNVAEYTLERYSNGGISERGGYAKAYGYSQTANYVWYRSESNMSYSSGFRVALLGDVEDIASDEVIVDVVDPVWEMQNLNIDNGETVTVDLVATDKYFDTKNSSELTVDDITVYIDGTNITELGYGNKQLSEATPLKEMRIINGKMTPTQYGVKYTLTLTNWQDTVRQEGKLYTEWSGTASIKIAEGKISDKSGNTNKEQNLELGHVDTINPEFTYIYSESDIVPKDKTVKVVFSVTDKYFKQSTLAIQDLIIMINGEQPEWRTEGGTTGVTKKLTSEEITEERNGENVTIGYRYTLLLSDLEQEAIASGAKYLDYSGVVTVAIPKGKVEDTSGHTNRAQTITMGIDLPIEGLPSLSYTNPYLPEGFSPVEGTDLTTGFVIQDKSGNQYVWVEVPRNTTVYSASTLALDLDTLSGETLTTAYNTIESELQKYAKDYRTRPSTNTDTHISDSLTGLTSSEYTKLKQKMLKSVFENGGFYVGRYETGTTSGRTSGSTTTTPTATPYIKANLYPYTYVTPSQAQTLAEEFAGEGYTTSLMFGIQWDLIMKHLETKAVEKGTSLATIQEQLKGASTGSTNWGNYYNTLWTITNTSSKYSTNGTSWTSGLYNGTGRKTSNARVLLTTGASDTFSKQNIYDLAGNVREWTLENQETYNEVVYRGGYYGVYGWQETANDNFSENGDYKSSYLGFRVTLFRDEETLDIGDLESGTVADVVDPLWQLQDANMDSQNKKFKVDLIVTDKYFDSEKTELTREHIKVYMNGTDVTALETVGKNLSEPTPLTEEIDGETVQYGAKYTLELTNVVVGSSSYVEFTPTEPIVGETAKYSNPSGGGILVEIVKGAATDKSGNLSKQQTLEVEGVDFAKPEIYDVRKIQDPIEKTETIIFNVTDIDYDPSDLITAEEITVWVDGEQVNNIEKYMLSCKEINTEIAGEPKTVGHQYTLILSNITEAMRQTGKDYLEWSGTLEIKIDGNAAKELGGNTLNTATTTISDFVDFIKPQFTYIYSESDIDYTGKTLKAVFSVTDKYFKQSTLAVEDLIILVDGKEPKWRAEGETTGVTREFIDIKDIEATIDGESKVIGKEYTLLLSNLEQNPNDGFNYSGIVTIGIPEGKVTDTKGNTNNAESITMGIDITEIELPRTEYTMPYLPTGHSYVLGDLSTGIVIQDSNGNQYVWVEVPRNTTVYSAETLKLDLDSLSGDALTTAYATIENELHTYTDTYRRDADNVETGHKDEFPDDETVKTVTGIETVGAYNELKQKMLKSVFENGGFYVGRYETGSTTVREEGSATGIPTETPVIKANTYPYGFITPSQAQTLASTKFGGEGYTTSLMFGVQWDLIMKYLETKAIEKGVAPETIQEELKGKTTGSTNWGNYENNPWTISNENLKYQIDDETWIQIQPNEILTKKDNESIDLSTGASYQFSKQNIYDLAGNYTEATLEYTNDSDNLVVIRGGTNMSVGNNFYCTASGRDRMIWPPQLMYMATNYGFRVVLFNNEKQPDEEPVIADVVDPAWEAKVKVDEINKKVTIDLIGKDKYLDIENTQTITADDIKVFIEGNDITSLGYIYKTLSEPTQITENEVKYQLTLSYWGNAGKIDEKLYTEWSGATSIQIPAGKLIDKSKNTNKEQNIELGKIDLINPDFTYIYSESDIKYDEKTVELVFSVTDKYFNESTLKLEDLTILIDGEEPEWRTEGGTTGVTKEFSKVEDISASINGESKVIGKKYTLLLSNLQQKPNYGFDYSGVVTVAIPAGKVTDTAGNKNFAETITIGIDINQTETKVELPRTDYTIPYLPAGFSPVPGTDLRDGLVIQDSKGNQYVWVEVPRNTTVYSEETLALDLNKLNETELETAYAKIEEELNNYSKDYRDKTYSDTYVNGFGLSDSEYYLLKNKMLRSIFENGGFYVGRYETGSTNHRISGTGETPYIKANLYPYNYVTVAQAQTLASTKFAGNGYTTSIPFGIQWNLIMKYIETKEMEKNGSEENRDIQYLLKQDSQTWGNYQNSEWVLTNENSKYSDDGISHKWTNGIYTNKTKYRSVLLSTGASDSFSKQNIYDLAGNVQEFTLQSLGLQSSIDVTVRGGDYEIISTSANAHEHFSEGGSGEGTGFRVVLFQNPKQEEEGIVADVVDPIWEVQNANMDKENNKVTLDLIAKDKYIKESTITKDDIKIYVDGQDVISLGYVTADLSEKTELFEDRDRDGNAESKYGEKYTVTITNWTEEQKANLYIDWNGIRKIVIEEGTITDQSTNTSKETEIIILEESKEQYIPSFTNKEEKELSYTTDSRVDLTYVLYKNNMITTPYADGDYRVISTTTQLPKNTKLKLKDYIQGKVYYYHVTGENSEYEVENGRYLYKLSNFMEIGTTDLKYIDNKTYYNEDNVYVLEKYNLSIDFIDSETADKLAQETYLELRDSTGAVKYNNGDLTAKYNLYSGKNAIPNETISVEGTHNVGDGTLELPITITASLLEQDGILDTKYYDQIVGIAIQIVNKHNERINPKKLENFSITNGTETYEADENGVIRIPIIEGLGSKSEDYTLTITQGNLPTGTYTAEVILYTADDGKYYGIESLMKQTFNLTFKGLDATISSSIGVEVDNETRVINKTAQTKTINMTLGIDSPTTETNIRVELYKRKTTYTNLDGEPTFTGVSYELEDINKYLQQADILKKPEDENQGLITTPDSKEYMVSPMRTYTEGEEIPFVKTLIDDIATGEYKLVFKAYSNNTLVHEASKTFIVIP